MAAAISRVTSSVITQTFSSGCTRRHTRTAFRAPCMYSESKETDSRVPHPGRVLCEGACPFDKLRAGSELAEEVGIFASLDCSTGISISLLFSPQPAQPLPARLASPQ